VFLRTLSVGSLGLLAAACSPAPPAAPTSAPAPAPTRAPTAGAGPTAAPASTAAPAPTAAPATKAAPPITITFQHGSDVTTNKLYAEVFIPGYQQMHPNVTIQHEATPNIEQKLLVEFATNAAPTMFDANANTLQALMAKGVLSAVPPDVWGESSSEAMLAKYYLPRVMNVLMRDGQLFGIPNQMNASSLMVNTRLFQEAGLDPVKDAPRTWDEIVALQPTLTKRDAAGQITQKGFEFVWARPDTISGSLQLLTYQAGGKVLESDGVTPAFNTDAGVRALETIKKVSIDPAVTHNTAAVVQQDWATELNAMYTGGPNTGILAEAINPALKGKWRYSDLPQLDLSQPAATYIVFSICVNNTVSADQKAVAHDFIRYMAQQPEVWLKDTGQLTPVVSLQTSPTAREIMPFLDVAIHDLQIARPPLQTAYGPQLNTALQAAAERVVYGGMAAQASLEQAAADFEQATKA
jgi:multiple sugar transport system substrate-binding protein